jgi:hypothetical protein
VNPHPNSPQERGTPITNRGWCSAPNVAQQIGSCFDPAGVVPAPILSTPLTRLPGGPFQLKFRNTPGLSFEVVSSVNPVLPPASWPSLGTAAEISPGHYQFTDPQAAPDPHRFYRVHSPGVGD